MNQEIIIQQAPKEEVKGSPLQQWADLISKEFGIRIAPKGFKKRKDTGVTVVNLDYLTQERFIHAGETMVNIHNYHIQKIGQELDQKVKDFDSAINDLRVEIAAQQWYNSENRKRLQSELDEATARRDEVKSCISVLINTAP